MWRVVIGGTAAAKERWPSQDYKHKSSANRRRKQIRDARDIGVATIWIIPVEEEM